MITGFQNSKCFVYLTMTVMVLGQTSGISKEMGLRTGADRLKFVSHPQGISRHYSWYCSFVSCSFTPTETVLTVGGGTLTAGTPLLFRHVSNAKSSRVFCPSNGVVTAGTPLLFRHVSNAKSSRVFCPSNGVVTAGTSVLFRQFERQIFPCFLAVCLADNTFNSSRKHSR